MLILKRKLKWRKWQSNEKYYNLFVVFFFWNLIRITLKKPSSGPNLIAKTTIYTICCFKNVGVPGTPHFYMFILSYFTSW
jgi:hypothetical protein